MTGQPKTLVTTVEEAVVTARGSAEDAWAKGLAARARAARAR